ncbi:MULTISPECIES: DUF6879 family protein [Nocardia]|uniref:DUF6879 family protein n=1 Tax=Nocardia TaxID=1817 RepID=UPI000D6986B2|nr:MULTISPECIES: DUF6879 family protein [Nocardia]
MRLVQGETFNDLLRSARSEAFHLEVQDSYECPEDAELLRAFLDGEPDDYGWMSDWAGFVRELTANGVAVRRARVVTVPHVAWTRWGLEVAAVNIAAGEDIRYLPRHQIGASVGSDDWWLIDGRVVAYTVFDEAGTWQGAAVTDDPVLASRCCEIRDAVWGRATPRSEYVQTSQQ